MKMTTMTLKACELRVMLVISMMAKSDSSFLMSTLSIHY